MLDTEKIWQFMRFPGDGKVKGIICKRRYNLQLELRPISLRMLMYAKEYHCCLSTAYLAKEIIPYISLKS